MDLDLILRGGSVVTHDGELAADIGIAEGKIVSLDLTLDRSARQTINVSGFHVLPGVIDSHVHFNDPGRAHWEGIETGSRALAAGGGTAFFDMPLNSSPPTLDAASFDAKLAVAQKKSLVDFAFWGGLVPGNLKNLEALAQRGVIGFKAFMCDSGIAEFPRSDDATLREGMKRAAQLGKIVAVHAESDVLTRELTQQAIIHGKTTARDYLASRPIIAELDAIQRALDLASETQCALHIVHVSCSAGVALIASARKLGVDVTCETCPHYLSLTESDMEELGVIAKCAPPLRPSAARDALWQYVSTQQVSTIGSDHSPSPPEMKSGTDFFSCWGGISGIQHTLPVLLREGYMKRGVPLSVIARLTSFNVIERFGLPHSKGTIAIGSDADLAVVDLKQPYTVSESDLLDRHGHNPYVGRTLTGRVVRTILRGQTVFHEGSIVSPPIGRLIEPQRNIKHA
jgi:allantoinase